MLFSPIFSQRISLAPKDSQRLFKVTQAIGQSGSEASLLAPSHVLEHSVTVTMLLKRVTVEPSTNSFFLLCFPTLPWQDTIERKKEDFMLQNEEASVKFCQADLEKFSKPLMSSISRRTFSVPGVHSLYLEAKRKVEQDYQLVPRKGVKVRNQE
jgi:hypothetical protein